MASQAARWRSLPILLLVSLSLAGCLGGDDAPSTGAADATSGSDTDDDNETLVPDTTQRPSIEGFVTDPARTPLEGVTVAIQNRNGTTTTDAQGRYEFYGLANEEVHILIASLDGYQKSALQVVPVKDKMVRLDFVLDPEPEATPYSEVIERTALISCHFVGGAGHDHGGNGTEVDQECSALTGLEDTNADDQIQIEVGPGVAGIVVEAVWTPGQNPLAEFLRMRVETVGFGDLDAELGDLIGNSPLQIPLAQDAVARYYTGDGGVINIDLDAHFEDDDEQAAGVSFAFQQEVDLYVSAFYVEPNPKSYTAIPDA